MKKYLALFLVLILMLNLFAACSKEEAENVNNNAEEPVNVENTDPGTADEEGDTDEQTTPIESLTIVTDVWEGMDMFLIDSWVDGAQSLAADSILAMADDGRALPNIASESVWSEDGLTWTLTFPEGMYYSTGEQLEPEDVVASIEHGLEYSTWADGYKTIESMEVDGRNVIIHLSEYQADMEYNFMSSFVGVIDKDELDTMSNDELLWGCHPYGAYYVEEFSPGAYVTLKANPGYVTHNPLVENKGKMPVETLNIVMGGEDFTYYTGLINGDYDLLNSAPADYLEDLQASDAVTLVESCCAMIGYAEFNIKNEFLADKNVRMAIIRGFDRDKYEQYSDDYNDATYCLVQNNCLNYDPEVEAYYKENYGYDVEAAKQYLADSGWADTDGDAYVDKDGKKLSFVFSSRDANNSIIVAQALQEDLKAIGIEMTITTQDWSYVNQDVVDGNYDMAFLNLGWSEPMLLVDNFCNRSDIAAECSNLDREGYLELVAKARATVDYDERTEVISEIQYKLFDYATILPLIRGTAYRCWSSKLQGIISTPTGSLYLNDVYMVEEN